MTAVVCIHGGFLGTMKASGSTGWKSTKADAAGKAAEAQAALSIAAMLASARLDGSCGNPRSRRAIKQLDGVAFQGPWVRYWRMRASILRTTFGKKVNCMRWLSTGAA
jgi:hypothetical protein